jgi:hypothetical protein
LVHGEGLLGSFFSYADLDNWPAEAGTVSIGTATTRIYISPCSVRLRTR